MEQRGAVFDAVSKLGTNFIIKIRTFTPNTCSGIIFGRPATVVACRLRACPERENAIVEKQMRNYGVKLTTPKTNLPVYKLAQLHKAAAATTSQHGSGQIHEWFHKS
jgi:hypothetical protein